MPLGWLVDTEVNAPQPGKKDDHCDIVVSYQGVRCALELVAHARSGPADRHGTVAEHFRRASVSYSMLSGLKEVWVINFTTCGPENGYVWPEKGSSVHAAHVWHDLKWTQAVVTLDGEQRQVNLLATDKSTAVTVVPKKKKHGK